MKLTKLLNEELDQKTKIEIKKVSEKFSILIDQIDSLLDIKELKNDHDFISHIRDNVLELSSKFNRKRLKW